MDRVAIFLMALVALLEVIPSHSHGSHANGAPGHENDKGNGHEDHGNGHGYGHNPFFKLNCSGNHHYWEWQEGCPIQPVSWFSSPHDFRSLLECNTDSISYDVFVIIEECLNDIEDIQNTNDGWSQDHITDYVFYRCFMKEMGFYNDDAITVSDFTSIFDSWDDSSVDSLIETMKICFDLTENPHNKIQWFLDVMACYATECHGIVGSTPVESCDLEIGCIKDALMDAAQFYYDFDTSEFGDFEDNPFVHFDMIMSAIRSSLSDNCRIEISVTCQRMCGEGTCHRAAPFKRKNVKIIGWKGSNAVKGNEHQACSEYQVLAPQGCTST
ncbi:uncharacterized protein LOC143035561 [Oratosquilla oratoria]|uniref:uncharacterized protein LOC143035561 n=1 Tax=Oratosquilla oratoria TaxID=337810 RepID=UPI003F75F651